MTRTGKFLKKSVAYRRAFWVNRAQIANPNPNPLNIMEKIRQFSKIVSLITVIAFFSGCAETKDAQQTQAQGTALGAAGGAALGALIGYATGGASGAAQGAIAGGIAGGALGFAYGTNVANEKAKYANAEVWVDNCIASAKQANKKAYAYNSSLTNKIAALETRSKTAIASHDKAAIGKIRSEIAGLKTQATNEQQQVDKYISAQSNVTGDKDAQASAKYAAYKSELGELRQTDASMSKNLSRLAALEKQTNL